MENQNTESQTPNTVPTPNTPPVQIPVQKNNNSVIIVVCLLIAIVVGISAYLYGVNQGKKVSESQITTIPTITNKPTSEAEAVQPTSTQSEDTSFGSTSLSYAESGAEIYIKQVINLTDPKVQYPNSKSRVITTVYSQDTSLDPREVSDMDISKFSWTDLIKEPIKDAPNAKSIVVNDRLFSFKKIPNSSNFLFVEEWDRSAGQNTGSWSPYQLERVVFIYDRSQGKGIVKKVQAFVSKENSFTYPKIDTFSPDGRYVSLTLFGCWECGGHQPETLLLNLQTLKTKNIGKVLQFSWGQNGSYSYKDYVVIDCKEPQPGVCSQNPDSLQLKMGQL